MCAAWPMHVKLNNINIQENLITLKRFSYVGRHLKSTTEVIPSTQLIVLRVEVYLLTTVPKDKDIYQLRAPVIE